MLVMNSRTSYILEILWLLIGVGCLVLGINRTCKVGFNNSYMLFILSLVAFIMYSLRRYARKSQEKK